MSADFYSFFISKNVKFEEVIIELQQHNSGSGYGYFKWYNTSTYEKCDKLVRHRRRLTKRIRELEAKVEETSPKEKMMKMLLLVAFVYIVQKFLWKD